MIGIHIYDNTFEYKDNHTNITKSLGQNYKCTISYHKQYKKEVFFENDDYMIFIDGWIFNFDDYLNQAENVLKLYIEYKNDFIYKINGQFNLLIFDKNNETFNFYNDIFAFRKHYVSFERDILCISSDQNFIKSSLANITLNKEHIIKNLNLPRFIDINETFILEINQVTPCSIISSQFLFENYSLEKVKSNFLLKKIDNCKDFINFIDNKIQNIHLSDNIILLLTGGLDSRFMLETFNKLKLNLTTATYGNKISDEVIIANNVAKANEIEHFICHLNDSDFFEEAQTYIDNYQGLDIFVQSTIYKFYNYLKDKISYDSIIDTGFALDVFLGGTYLSEDHRFENSIDVKNKVQFEINDKNEFSTINRVFSTLSIRQSAHREFFEDRYSMYNYEIYFIMKELDSREIKGYKFYYELCKLQITNSFHIPLQSTMFDLNLEPKYWSDAESIQKEKEKFVYEYFRKTGNTLFHNRYYSDFDMWIRNSPIWIREIEKLFKNRESILSKQFIKNEIIQESIDEHMECKKSNLRNIVKWISLELFLLKNEGILNSKENNEK